MSEPTTLPVFHVRARTFSFAARFLPAELRRPVGRLYSFARVVDDLVDEPSALTAEQTRSILAAWHAWLDSPSSLDGAPDPAVAAEVLPILVDNGVPPAYLQMLVAGVASDLNPRAMQSWPELRDYCVQVASSVGLAMCHLLGAGEDPLARQAAVDLGIAMQLTNILRDIREDVNASRIYLPADELAAHATSPEHLRWFASRASTRGAAAIDTPFCELMRAQVERARAHYRSGLEGIWRLPADGRFAILLAGRAYEAILDLIEAVDYDVFSGRVATSMPRKLGLAIRCWLALRTPRSSCIGPALASPLPIATRVLAQHDEPQAARS